MTAVMDSDENSDEDGIKFQERMMNESPQY